MIKSTGLRLSVFVAGLILLSLLLAGLAASISARDSAIHLIKDQLSLEVSAIELELALEGLEATVLAIDARTDQHGAFSYRLVDQQDLLLAGDLPTWAYIEGFHEIQLARGASAAGSMESYFVLTRKLDEGLTLTVAEEFEKAFVVHSAIVGGLVWAGGISAALCLSAGVLITRRLLRRLDDLAELAAQVAKGNLDARYRQFGEPGQTDIDDIGRSLDAMLERINVLLGGLRRITRDIAHDLRTPLSLLKQQLEEARVARTLEDASARVAQANDKVDEVLRIFDAILRLGEIEAGSSRERFTSLSLSDVVEDVALAYQPEVDEAGGQLDIDIQPGIQIIGDRQLLAQAVANLIENALCHGGTAPTVRVEVSAINGCSSVRIADNGFGVEQDLWPEIVKPFARLDPARSKSGTGLGLAIVSAIVSLHDGRLSFSKDASGFAVSLEFVQPAIA